MPEWDTDQLRLTCLLAGSAGVDEPRWWSDLTGNPPESRASRPRLGQLTESGPFEGRNLTLSVAPGRVDWLIGPPEQAQSDTGILTVGPYPQALEFFTELMRRWLSLIPAVQRLAFGAVLHRLVGDRLDGYRHLQAYLPSVRLDPDSYDFMYQINRPRPSSSEVPNLTINRLSKWSVMSMAGVSLLMGREFVQQRVRATAIACRLELDMNTQAEFPDELPKERINAIFGELVALGTEIATRGDVP